MLSVVGACSGRSIMNIFRLERVSASVLVNNPAGSALTSSRFVSSSPSSSTGWNLLSNKAKKSASHVKVDTWLPLDAVLD
jgi:hypothetical protein